MAQWWIQIQTWVNLNILILICLKAHLKLHWPELKRERTSSPLEGTTSSCNKMNTNSVDSIYLNILFCLPEMHFYLLHLKNFFHLLLYNLVLCMIFLDTLFNSKGRTTCSWCSNKPRVLTCIRAFLLVARDCYLSLCMAPPGNS